MPRSYWQSRLASTVVARPDSRTCRGAPHAGRSARWRHPAEDRRAGTLGAMRAEQITAPVAYHGEGPCWSASWGGLRFVETDTGLAASLLRQQCAD